MDTYEKTLTLKTRNCDLKAAWRLREILEEMQECAGEHCEALDISRAGMLEQNRAWVLVRTHLEMDRYPTIGDPVTILTFPKASRHMLYPRFFLFQDASGAVFGKASTLWTIMDLKTRRAVPDPEMDARLPRNEQLPSPMPYPGAARKVDGALQTQLYTPLYSDLDSLGHVNNARYADWLCNILGPDRMRRSTIRSMTVNYNHELLPDHALELRWTEQEHTIWLSGGAPGETAFELSAEYTDAE